MTKGGQDHHRQRKGEEKNEEKKKHFSAVTFQNTKIMSVTKRTVVKGSCHIK
jgi:hypothetical protein